MVAVVADAPDEGGELRRLLRVHPRRRLVEEQELRLGGERAGDLEPALVTVGQRAGAVVVAPRQAAVAEQLPGALVRLGLLALDTRRLEDRPEDARLQAGVHSDEDVLDRGHLLEEPDVLERPPHA